MNDERLEELMVALNWQLFDESIGLPCDEWELDRLTGELEQEYRQAATDPDRRDMTLDGLANMLSTRWHPRWLDAVDSVLIAPNLATGGEPATWHNWKRMEQALYAQARRRLFAKFVSRSEQLISLVEGRHLALRQRTIPGVILPRFEFWHTCSVIHGTEQKRVTGNWLSYCRLLLYGLGQHQSNSYHSCTQNITTAASGTLLEVKKG